jgi:hypothetical protein
LGSAVREPFTPGEAVQELQHGAVKCVESLFLNPGGDHPPRQVRRELFRGRAPEYRLPASPQRIAAQPPHALDLRRDGRVLSVRFGLESNSRPTRAAFSLPFAMRSASLSRE